VVGFPAVAPQTHGAALPLCRVQREAVAGTAGLPSFDMKYENK